MKREGLRQRHPLTDAEEHAFMLAGSKLFNARKFFETHEEWEEVWRRASGPRRELLRGLIQIAVGYEHVKRGNDFGARSLLRQGIRRLKPHARKPGVGALVLRAEQDVARIAREPGMTLRKLKPPRVVAGIRGFDRAPRDGDIEIEVPRATR